MNKHKRKYISTRQRFEIFKRDDYTCQYCGAKAPDVKLHVDHLVPVCSGGDNMDINLITACDKCNFGKSGVSLSDKAIVFKQIREINNYYL